MQYKKIAVIILCSLMISLTGCWNNEDITRLALATAVGIDKAEDGMVEVTVQIAKPSSLSSEGQASGGGAGEKKAYVVETAKGSTIFEAVRNMLHRLDRRVFYSNVQTIVISESLAAQGVNDVLDFFVRQHETRPTAGLMVTRGVSPKEVLSIESDLEPIPAVALMEAQKSSNIRATILQKTLLDLLKDLEDEGKECLLCTVLKDDNGKLLVEGSAIISHGKLQGWLDSKQTRGFRFAATKIKSALLNIPNPLLPDEQISIEAINSNSSIGVKYNNGLPVFVVKVKMHGSIAEQEGSGDTTKVEFMNKLNEGLRKEVEKEIRNSLEIVQKNFKADIYGFGNLIYKYNYGYWQTVRDNWDEVFSNASVIIDVDSEIKRVGLLRKPASEERKE